MNEFKLEAFNKFYAEGHTIQLIVGTGAPHIVLPARYLQHAQVLALDFNLNYAQPFHAVADIDGISAHLHFPFDAWLRCRIPWDGVGRMVVLQKEQLLEQPPLLVIVWPTPLDYVQTAPLAPSPEPPSTKPSSSLKLVP
jgi:hypothetical protein